MPNYLIMYKIYVWNPFRLMYIGVSGLVSKEKKDQKHQYTLSEKDSKRKSYT